MTPWSVSPSAGWPNSAARSASASILHAPSSSEYSEWTCRCAQAGVLTGRLQHRRPVRSAPRARAEDFPHSADARQVRVALRPLDPLDEPGQRRYVAADRRLALGRSGPCRPGGPGRRPAASGPWRRGLLGAPRGHHERLASPATSTAQRPPRGPTISRATTSGSPSVQAGSTSSESAVRTSPGSGQIPASARSARSSWRGGQAACSARRRRSVPRTRARPARRTRASRRAASSSARAGASRASAEVGLAPRARLVQRGDGAPALAAGATACQPRPSASEVVVQRLVGRQRLGGQELHAEPDRRPGSSAARRPQRRAEARAPGAVGRAGLGPARGRRASAGGAVGGPGEAPPRRGRGRSRSACSSAAARARMRASQVGRGAPRPRDPRTRRDASSSRSRSRSSSTRSCMATAASRASPMRRSASAAPRRRPSEYSRSADSASSARRARALSPWSSSRRPRISSMRPLGPLLHGGASRDLARAAPSLPSARRRDRARQHLALRVHRRPRRARSASTAPLTPPMASRASTSVQAASATAAAAWRASSRSAPVSPALADAPS